MFFRVLFCDPCEWEVHLGCNYVLYLNEVCNNRFVKYERLGKSQCRERAERSFEMMKNISRKNNKAGRRVFSPEECLIIPESYWGVPGTVLTIFMKYWLSIFDFQIL